MLPSCGITSFSLPLQSSKRAPSVNVSSNQELRPFDASDTTALKVSLAMADPNFSLRWNVKPKGCLTLRLENLPAWSVVVFVPSVEHFFGLHHLHFFLSIDFSIFPRFAFTWEDNDSSSDVIIEKETKSWLFLVRFFYSLKREELTFQWKIIYRKWVSNFLKCLS